MKAAGHNLNPQTCIHSTVKGVFGMFPDTISCGPAILVTALIIVFLSGHSHGETISNAQIIVGKDAPAMEKLAARELQRYCYELSGNLFPIVADSAVIDKTSFVVGQKSSNGKILALVKAVLLYHRHKRPRARRLPDQEI